MIEQTTRGDRMTHPIPAFVIRTAAVVAAAPIVAWSVAPADSAETIPNLTGVWARTTFALEQPPSGPGPLRNPGAVYKGQPAYTSPILKPEAARIVKERYESTLAGKPFPTPSSTCWPMVAPLIYRVQGMQLLQQKNQVTFVYMQDHEVRRVRLNAQHPAKVTPSWHGDSIGHYDGDTLVVDTIGVKVGPVSLVDQAGSPYSEALHVIERYRLISYEEAKEARERNVAINGPPATNQAASIDPNYVGQGLQVSFTVVDPNVFTTPWSGLATYSKADDLWTENVCAENTFEYYNNRDTAVPQADKPDF
jgi:hypothetical protein